MVGRKGANMAAVGLAQGAKVLSMVIFQAQTVNALIAAVKACDGTDAGRIASLETLITPEVGCLVDDCRVCRELCDDVLRFSWSTPRQC